jgi:hypothetical protein
MAGQEPGLGFTGKSSIYSDQIFKPEYLLLYTQFSIEDIPEGNKMAFIDSLKNREVPLQTSDPALINSFGNAILATRSNRSHLLNDVYPKAKRQAIEIIELLKTEYHLE